MSEKSFPHHPVLLVDDEPAYLASASFILKGAGITNVITCGDSRQVLPLLGRRQFSAVLLDLTMPHMTGNELLPEILQLAPDTAVIIVTAINEVETAVECMKQGALDYLVKPLQGAAITHSLDRALKFHEIHAENTRLKECLFSRQLAHPGTFAPIITGDKQMMAIFKYVEAIAETPLPVLITGETGVGKESLARAIHDLSRLSGNLVAVNAAGLDDNLFSDTLFGHRKGGFTGAAADRKGMLETAAAGALFLDEIGDLSIPSQVKLLRLLQDGSYYPLGADSPKITDARFICATNVDLEEAVDRGRFRKDLYYRLRSHRVHIPPLRERTGDIPMLFAHFLENAARLLKKKVPRFPPELLTLLAGYHFPGNIRELQTMIYDALARHQKGILSMTGFKEIIGFDAEPSQNRHSLNASDGENLMKLFNGRFPTLKEAEGFLVSEALKQAQNNQGIAASLLGLTRNALNKRLVREKK
jgi:DNA-binding NtrC family response regulator